MRRTVLAAALTGALALPGPSPASTHVQRVEITGSAVARIEGEGALPVQVLRRNEIVRTGATSTTDLLQRLPALQGGFRESGALGLESGGFSGAAIHNLGDTRTLVLLNGRRLATFGGQSLDGDGAAVDLNAIPLAAVERVEVLTDGASALYGADAVAGVINIITRQDAAGRSISVGGSSPRGGAHEQRASATLGVGSLAADGFNAMLTMSHDKRRALASSSRSFADSGDVTFERGGQRYRRRQVSIAPIPANALDDQGQLISPYALTNGSCPPRSVRVVAPSADGSGRVDDYCGYDFIRDIELYPARQRDSVFASLTRRTGAAEWFAQGLWTRTRSVARIAPASGAVAVDAGSPLHTRYLAPLGIASGSLAFYRFHDLGQRVSDDSHRLRDLAIGVRGAVADWDVGLTWGRSESISRRAIAGYPGALAVRRLGDTGLLDPFVEPGQQSAEAQAAIAAANYRGDWGGGSSTLDSLTARAARDVGRTAVGPVQLALGAALRHERFRSTPSLFAQGRLADPVRGTLCDPASSDPARACDQRFGDAATSVPFQASRRSAAVFGELLTPLDERIELTTAVRADRTSDFGSATTAKVALRVAPSPRFLLRASLGSGFRAPTLPQVGAPAQPFGVTSGAYACTPALARVAGGLGATCAPGIAAYDVVASGNPDLRPERSRQASIGLRFEPDRSLSMGVDLWHIRLRNTFGQLSEAQVFADPQGYADAWTTRVDPATGVVRVALKTMNRNLGRSSSTGLDIDVAGRLPVRQTVWTSQLRATYLVREKRQLVPGGPYLSAIGNFADLGVVSFRWQGAWTNALRVGDWTHALSVQFRSGYRDRATEVERIDDDGSVLGVETLRLRVPSHVTLDWQTRWEPRSDIVITAGVTNLLDAAPPLSISVGGIARGQPSGYDDRYSDPRGRTLYLNLDYVF